LLYLLASGRHPVADLPIIEAIVRYEEKRIDPPSTINSEISPELDELIMRALEPRPESRWQTAQEFGNRIHELMMTTPTWRLGLQRGAADLVHLVRELFPDATEDLRLDVAESQFGGILPQRVHAADLSGGMTVPEEPAKTDELPATELPTQD